MYGCRVHLKAGVRKARAANTRMPSISPDAGVTPPLLFTTAVRDSDAVVGIALRQEVPISDYMHHSHNEKYIQYGIISISTWTCFPLGLRLQKSVRLIIKQTRKDYNSHFLASNQTCSITTSSATIITPPPPIRGTSQ
jgi:hypothetical protein